MRCMIGLVAALACGPACADVVTVFVFDFDFSVNMPDEQVVDAVVTEGDTVHWVFIDGGHTVTAVEGIPEQFDSGLGGIGDTFEHTFTNAGTWWYYCIPHGQDNGDGTADGMAGTVVVLPAGCPGDFDGNGRLDVFDFLAYQTAFGNEDPSADLAEPFGVFNVFDFLAFQSAFGNGC